MAETTAFTDEIKPLLQVERTPQVLRWFETLAAQAVKLPQPAEAAILQHPQMDALLAQVFAHSPFLSKIIVNELEFLLHVAAQGADAGFAMLRQELENQAQASQASLMKAMRIAKSRASLLIALADIGGVWPLEKVTLAMSEFAGLCIRLTLAHLLQAAATKGDIRLKYADDPERESGVFVLAMGKLGAYELNYSSDIDLIVFFDRDGVTYTGNNDVQHCLSKIAHELVRLLQERTAEGYVFRVDLRLRPDPASTPPAMSVAGAMTYYETVGQNWERAAFIKARVIAGDTVLGEGFLKQLTPFVWRKHLDFAAIADIQSIKRQMDERTGRQINVAGHNIKTGLGGIREIEFFAQIHQLIWGGRIQALRQQATCKTLEALSANRLIESELAQRLITSYRFFRSVEHRLQMVDDHQTHTMPVEQEARVRLARFMEYADVAAFEKELLAHLEFVHDNFAGAFRGQYSLSGEEGKLSFTGVENDPQTLETLRKMGYRNPASVSEVIQGWHRGSRRATRTKRARELITELTPTLLKELAATTAPDQAFIYFDEFLARLPAGVQLFSLFSNNPHLLKLIALIMGSAPAMAESLSKNPGLLDTVLTTGFYNALASGKRLAAELSETLRLARDFEEEMDILRRFKQEKQFQAGVQLIGGHVDAFTASRHLSAIAEVCLEAMLLCTERNFAAKQPDLQENSLAVIALGRLGARELTFGSDIDMVFVYDSEVQNPLLPPQHSIYNKLSQRFISSVTSLTREGRLYEIDTRLRPSGGDGALAVGVGAFEKYFRESAWTFELMAFTRARVITGHPMLREQVQRIITENIRRPHTAPALAQDIKTLRAKITREFGSDNIWNLKYVHGGLMDLDFLAQYFVLLHAEKNPEVIAGSTGVVLRNLMGRKLIEEKMGRALREAHEFFTSLFALLRLCGGGVLDEATAPDGLKHLIAARLELEDFTAVRTALLDSIATVKQYFEEIIEKSNA
ncbi:MAG TPA: bifunctional [glutamine synthetase] adenylyltransferase/[glutamine synthetase]-adenylyl-L-tyrosine phosphorylase [Rickettsiales bacterium]|nr:bifunctional [glutamine synthetase] adenylyltransferase/[glutamine synthetase]-adenylyl-L-tyrosine phosphorylase [Rickettsiales bacterium]